MFVFAPRLCARASQVEGRGTFTLADGSAEVGRWEGGQPVGEATRFSPDHRTAWRLFDGQVTGQVSLDLADVIAQMAFRPKAARLARAVRDQLNFAQFEDELLTSDDPTPLSAAKRPPEQQGRALSPLPITDRPPWQGPFDVLKRTPSPVMLAAPADTSISASEQASPMPDRRGAGSPEPAAYPTCHTPGFLQAHKAASHGKKGPPAAGLLNAMLPESFRAGRSARSNTSSRAKEQSGAGGTTPGAYMC